MKIVIVSLSDWSAMYDTNGNIYSQGHDIQKRDLFKLLQETNEHPKNIELVFKSASGTKLEEEAENSGNLPYTLQECIALGLQI